METWANFIRYITVNSDKLIVAIQHHIIYLVIIPVVIAVLIAVPLGIICTRWKTPEKIVIPTVSVIQTIPSLALLAFMITLGLGIGYKPAIIAIILYALLPILRNTYAGIKGVDSSITEAAKGMGMTNFQMLIDVELPLAAPFIMAGIRTATVISVGAGTIAALIGAGGLGQFILTGLSQVRPHIILAGAVPAAFLALLFDWLLGKLENVLVPKGLKI